MARAPKKATARSGTLIEAILLSRFECVQFPPEEAGGTRELFLDLAMSKAERGEREGQYFSQVLCKCLRKNDPDAAEVYFTAIYSVLFEADGKDLEHVTLASKDAVASAAWLSFYSMFTLANGQMRAKMPMLPFAKSGVDIREMDQLLEAFNVLDEEPEGLTS